MPQTGYTNGTADKSSSSTLYEVGKVGGAGEGIYNGIFYSDSTYGQSIAGVSFRISLGK